MIVFYNRKSGEVTALIKGRIHTEAQKKMWVGSRENVDRLIIEYEKEMTGSEEIVKDVMVKVGVDEEGNGLFKQVKETISVPSYRWSINRKDKKIIEMLERRQAKKKDLFVNLKTKTLYFKSDTIN